VNVSQNAPRISLYGNGSRKRLLLWGKALATEKHNVNEFVDRFKSPNGSIILITETIIAKPGGFEVS
jgi:hypothetical protein